MTEHMLATKVLSPPRGPDWTWELKFDGLRAFAIVEGSRLTLRSRRGTDMTGWFPELASVVSGIGSADAIVDGEIILADGSVAAFNRLLKRVRSRGRGNGPPATFVAFDVVRVDGVDVTGEPLDARRARLSAMIKESERIVVSRVYSDGTDLFAAAVAHGMEGVVGKDRTSLCAGGRSRAWVKVKAPDAAARHEWSGTSRSAIE